MAFDYDGTTDGHQAPSAPAAYPISLSAWFNADAFAALSTIECFCRTSTPVNNRLGIFCGVGGVANVAVVLQSGGTASSATGGTPVAGTWHHVGGIFTSTDIFTYLDGAQVATVGHALAFPNVTLIDLALRQNGVATLQDFFNGRLAEVAVWTADIGARGMAMLGAGAAPPLVFPNTLRDWWSMRSGSLINARANNDLTVLGTGGAPAAFAHVTRVFYPADASNFPTRNRRIGTGSSIIPMPVSAGTGVVVLLASGASVIPMPSSAGTGAVVVTGSGAATIPMPSSTGTAVVANMGSGAAIIPMPVSEGAGLHQQNLVGAGDAIIPMPVSEGAAEVVISASGASVIPMPVSEGVGTAVFTITAAGASVLPMPVSSGTAIHVTNVTAAGDAVIPMPVSSGTAVHTSVNPTIAITPTIVRLIVPEIRLVAVLSLRDLIDARIRQVVAAGPFMKVVHAPNGYKSSTLEVVTPTSVIMQEIQSSFDTPKRNRRTFREERQTWLWDVQLQFAVEVTLEAFEEAWLSDTPIVFYEGRPVTWLRLQSAGYDHPPYQDPNMGTRVRYVVRAEMAPS